MSINLHIVAGHLGRDPELRTSKAGMDVCTLSVATTHYPGKGRESETEWHRVVCFGRQATIASQYLRKGDMVCVVGRARTRTFTGQDGAERRMVELVADRVEFARPSGGGGPAEAPAPRGKGAGRSPTPTPARTPFDDADPAQSIPFDDDDVPF